MPRTLARIALLAMLLLTPCAHAAVSADTLAWRSVFPSAARFYALRLAPGQDVRQELLRFARERHLRAGFVASCAGSAARTTLRYANQPDATVREGHFEIVSLSGTLTADGAHLHASLADSTGATFGGHLMDGTRVYTTAEIVVGELERAQFTRETDSTYGYKELKVRKR